MTVDTKNKKIYEKMNGRDCHSQNRNKKKGEKMISILLVFTYVIRMQMDDHMCTITLESPFLMTNRLLGYPALADREPAPLGVGAT